MNLGQALLSIGLKNKSVVTDEQKIKTHLIEANSKPEYMTAARIDFFDKRSGDAKATARANLQAYYANRVFSASAVRSEKLFPIGHKTIDNLISQLKKEGILVEYYRKNNGTYYRFANCENPIEKGAIGTLAADTKIGYRKALIRETVLGFEGAFTMRELKHKANNLGSVPKTVVEEMLAEGLIKKIKGKTGHFAYEVV